uniref:Uncharacterized protein n=1 Tax=Pyramimonas obovata TaxID=1411642 RepID=A0A7S0N828_9CHLO|mmetsp:Transcript_22692/g.49697  ORF Transcript_22692/g.49697 Transcript_22692/m.49697 type:complete len:145 (+) Transcript_22692:257-691(+)
MRLRGTDPSRSGQSLYYSTDGQERSDMEELKRDAQRVYELEHEHRMKQDSDHGLMRKLQDMQRDAEERMQIAVQQGMGAFAKPSAAPIEKHHALLMQDRSATSATTGMRVNWEDQLRQKTRGKQQQMLHRGADRGDRGDAARPD